METTKQLLSKGYTIRANRYAQKDLGNGWYIGIDTKSNTVDAGHVSQLKPRENHMCYDWTKTNHTSVDIRGIKSVKNYVRNEEAHRVPSHMLVGWAELLESRLSLQNRLS